MGEIKKMPEIRFKGFNGEWEEAQLGEVVDFFSGLTYSPKDVVSDNGTFVLRSSNVKNGEIVNADDVFVNSEVVNCENVKEGDIAVVVRNGSRSLIGKHAQIKREMKNTVIGAFMTGIRSGQPNFTNALLDSEQFNKEVEKNLGATINQITTGAFRRMSFCFPGTDEQTKIGVYFQSLDKQLSLHQAKVTKLANLKQAMLEKMFPQNGADVPEIRFKGFEGAWQERTIESIFNYERPDNYIVKSVEYSDEYSTPVLTANKAFVLGYTNETRAFSEPSIIFDDFTLDFKYVDFPYMVKSSALKILTVRDAEIDNLIFSFNLLTSRKLETMGHARHYISVVQAMSVKVPNIVEQKKIGAYFQNLDSLITLHQTELDKLSNLKKACLEKMFV